MVGYFCISYGGAWGGVKAVVGERVVVVWMLGEGEGGRDWARDWYVWAGWVGGVNEGEEDRLRDTDEGMRMGVGRWG